jgi:predicted DNA-binding protein YlxM (UPF0122 family)
MVNNDTNIQTLHYKKRKFLEHYEKLCVIGKAAAAAGVSRQAIYDWLEKSKEFKTAFESVRKNITEMLEQEAIRRAYEGIDEPVYYKGDVCGAVRKYSDTLLIFLLKANDPEKYREKHEIVGEGGGAITLHIKYD